jgi:hypothetical protein
MKKHRVQATITYADSMCDLSNLLRGQEELGSLLLRNLVRFGADPPRLSQSPVCPVRLSVFNGQQEPGPHSPACTSLPRNADSLDSVAVDFFAFLQDGEHLVKEPLWQQGRLRFQAEGVCTTDHRNWLRVKHTCILSAHNRVPHTEHA